MPATLQPGTMAKQPLAETKDEGAQSPVKSPSVGFLKPPEADPEETPPSNIKKLVRTLSKKVKSPSVGFLKPPEADPEETPPSNIKKLVRTLSKKVKPSKEKGASPEVDYESAEDKLAGFISRNPKLFVPAEEEPKKASLEIPEPMVRTRTLSRSQRLLERLETPLILDPAPEEEVEEQERAKETMRQPRTARFRKRLEEYL